MKNLIYDKDSVAIGLKHHVALKRREEKLCNIVGLLKFRMVYKNISIEFKYENNIREHDKDQSCDYMDEIKIYELKRLDLRNSAVIDGFPSVGLVSTITANYLIGILQMEQIGILDSIHFPTVSVVRNSEPLNPVRVYAKEKINEDETQVVVFISEFQPPPNLIKMIAGTILDWMMEQGCKLLISPEGLVIDRGEGASEENSENENENEKEENEELDAYGIGSTENARKILREHDIQQFQEGVISGVAGVLLNEGKRRDFDVISLLAEARPNYPDARAAARVIEAIDKILLHKKIDVKPLYREAEGIEARIMSMQQQAKSPTKKKAPIPQMYG